ncbi:MAG: DUF3656 domain-containing protein [Clostridia bacterium]|nr:DUF3656 domain-containing protein [Clostridia bacterium]
MKRKADLPELLAPAGDMESLIAAVRGGADAVYIGGARFGARAYAKNFDLDGIAVAVRYCRLRGVRLYVTLNTLLSTREVGEAADFADELYRIGVDALIVCDIGLIKEIRGRGNPIELHASTQMSVHNSTGADYAAALGCSRVVLARELSLANIKATTERCLSEVEMFLHGALCVSHSGQCLFSSIVGGRSGNRGECAQPCRLPYNGGKHLLSLRDLSLAGHIPELIASGVASLKIEGRMKSPEYVYTVTSIYRRLLDEGRAARADEADALYRAFSRGGFTDGYLRGELGGMTGMRSEGDKMLSREITIGENSFIKTPVRASAEIKIGSPARLTLSLGGRSVTVTGEVVEAARSAPLTREAVAARLMKMGNTLLSLSARDIEITLDEGANLSPAALNALRRAAAEKLEDTSREPYPRRQSKRPAVPRLAKMKTALFFREELYFALCESGELDIFDIVFLPLAAFSGGGLDLTRPLGVYIPPVVTEGELGALSESLASLRASGVRYALVGNIGHYTPVLRAGLIPVLDFRLNITNSHALAHHAGEGAVGAVLSPELSLGALSHLGGGAIVYGRIPLMLTERCFIRESLGCSKCESAALTDRLGVDFPIIREAGHRNIILNSRPTYMGDRREELERAGLSLWHFVFSTEEPGEALSALRAFSGGEPLKGEVRRIKK